MIRLGTYGENGFKALFPYDAQFLARLKEAVPGLRWEPNLRAWVSDGPEVLLDLERANIPFEPLNYDARERIARFRSLLNDVIALKRRELGDETKPYSYQDVGAEFLALIRAGILADEMGLGKSRQALLAAERLGAKRLLIIAEKTLIWKWYSECEKWAPHRTRLIIPDAPKARSTALRRAAEAEEIAVITNYEKARSSWWPYDASWDVLIFDEAHRAKNRATKTYAAVRRIRVRSSAAFAISGSPLETRPEDLFAIMSIVRPAVLGESITRFRAAHMREEVQGNNIVWVLRRPDLLRERIAPWIMRRTKAQVYRQLPPKIHTDHIVELSAGERHLYDGLVKLAPSWLKADDPLVVLLRYQQLTSSPHLIERPDLGRGAKFEALTELLDGWDGRALVFTRFRSMAERLREWLGAPADAIITGAVADPRERSRRIAEFNAGRLGKVFVATDALSHGMDVSADLVVHYDLLWNPAKEAQREDRCHGIGRGIEGRVTHVVRLIARGTIDEGMRRVTARRSALSADIVDGAAGEAFLRRLSASAIQRLLAGEDIAA